MIIYAWFQGFAFALSPVVLEWNYYDYWEVLCTIDCQVEKEQVVY